MVNARRTDDVITYLPMVSISRIRELLADPTQTASFQNTWFILHPNELRSHTLSQALLDLLQTFRSRENQPLFIFITRVPNIPRWPLALIRREVRAVPESLKPFLKSVDLHLDILTSSPSLQAGYLVATCTPGIPTRNSLPSSQIFQGTGLTTPLINSPGYIFVEIASLFNHTKFSQEHILSSIRTDLSDEIATNSLIIIRKVRSPDSYELLTCQLACPRPSLSRIMNLAHSPINQEQPIIYWASSVEALDDLSCQSDHLLITFQNPAETNNDHTSELPASHPLGKLTRYIQSIGGGRDFTATPLTMSSILVTCPKGSLTQDLISQLPSEYKLRVLSTTAPSRLARPALMVYPILRNGQETTPRILSQLEETLRILFPSQTVERRQNGLRIHQPENITTWRNFKGYLGPLKVRMSLERDTQTTCDLWWTSLSKSEKDRINQARKTHLLTLSILPFPPVFEPSRRDEPAEELSLSSSQPKRRRTPSTSDFDSQPRLSGILSPDFQPTS